MTDTPIRWTSPTIDDPLALVITVDPENEQDYELMKSWVIGPFPPGSDYLETFSMLEDLGDSITDELLIRYPDPIDVSYDVVSIVPRMIADLDSAAGIIADAMVNEHRTIDPDLANAIDDLYVRNILDSIAVDD